MTNATITQSGSRTGPLVQVDPREADLALAELLPVDVFGLVNGFAPEELAEKILDMLAVERCFVLSRPTVEPEQGSDAWFDQLVPKYDVGQLARMTAKFVGLTQAVWHDPELVAFYAPVEPPFHLVSEAVKRYLGIGN